MAYVFEESKVTPTGMEHWNTHKVTSMLSMFQGQNKVNPITTNWDVRQVANFKNMFQDASFYLNIRDMTTISWGRVCDAGLYRAYTHGATPFPNSCNPCASSNKLMFN